MLACRSSLPLEDATRDKLALFCQVTPDSVLTMHDVTNIWQVPIMMLDQKAHITICNCLGLTGYSSINMVQWKTKLADRWEMLTEEITIAVIGKYTHLSDAYLSIIKALQHACLAMRRKLVIKWVEAAELEPEVGSNQCCRFSPNNA